MLDWPMSSPKITRMFGLRPDAVVGATAGAAFCVCAIAAEVSAAAATRLELPSRILRRLGPASPFPLAAPLLISSVLCSMDIRLSVLRGKGNHYAGRVLT